MTSTFETIANQKKLSQAYQAWQALLEEVLRRDFFGTATLEIAVQDGTIQSMRRKLEQVEK